MDERETGPMGRIADVNELLAELETSFPGAAAPTSGPVPVEDVAAYVASLPGYLRGLLAPGGADGETARAVLRSLNLYEHELPLDVRVSSLSAEQCLIVARALAYLAVVLEPGFERVLVEEALDSWWRPELLDVRGAIAELERAFPATAIALSPDALNRSYLDEERLRACFEGRRWTDLDQRSLEWFGDALSFYDPAAYAALLPAYLRATLRATRAIDVLPSSLLGSLSQRSHRLELRISALTAGQREAVVRALGCLAGHRVWNEDAARSLADLRELGSRKPV